MGKHLKYRLILLVLLLSLGELTCLAQKERPFGFNPIRKKENYSYCSFDLRANLIVVKTLIDKSDTLNFILDSGVQNTIILDTSLKSRIKQNIGREIFISGIGEAPPFTASVSIGHTIRFGGIVGYQQNIIFLDENFLNLSEYLGIPVHGILGSDIFKRFNVVIDYPRHELIFSDPSRYRYKKRKGVAVPLHLEKAKPYVIVNRLECNGKAVENLKLVIDTGGAHALLLNRETMPPGLMPQKLIDGHLGRGLNGSIEGKLGRIDALHFGNHAFKNVIATFPDSLHFDGKITQDYLLRNGSIGGEILKRFVVTMNYSQQLLVLKPIKKVLKKPFESDMSGMDVRATGEDFRTFEVTDVIEGSVADIAGVLPGDQIILFDKKLASNMTISDVYELLSRKEGFLIDLVVLRNRALYPISFRLKRTI